ncbi:MAG: TPM domain-containing protein [Lachnospiraceae bacterium]|nr:TPM domain-containing protein [Lachnospiraceae bacterium]
MPENTVDHFFIPKYALILSRFICLCFVMSALVSVQVYASEGYTNPDTGFRTVMEDDANLLSSEQEEELAALLQEITDYGNAAFKTLETNPYSSTSHFAENYYAQLFGSTSGTLFLIDMDYRMLWIYSDGVIYKTITKSYANTITDNVYRYASNGDYFTCSYEAFSQILALLEGSRIAQPMKYASNAFLAVVMAMFLCYFLTRYLSALKSPSNAHVPLGMKSHYRLEHANVRFTHKTKTYSPVSSDSGSGSGGGSSGSSGGGGGGHSGGGGGHRF